VARQVKPYGDHNQRWQREQAAKGVEPKRWDKWRGLSSKSRADSDPERYGKGFSVNAIRRGDAIDKATGHIAQWGAASSGRPPNRAIIERRVRGESIATLRKIPTMTGQQMRTSAIRARKRGLKMHWAFYNP
jgi:hypothetical protein